MGIWEFPGNERKKLSSLFLNLWWSGLPGLSIRVILASEKEFESAPSVSILSNSLRLLSLRLAGDIHCKCSSILLWLHLALDCFWFFVCLFALGFFVCFKLALYYYSSSVMGLSRLLTSWLNFSGLAESWDLTMSFRFSNLMKYRFLKYSLIIVWISLVSVELFPCSFLIPLIWVLYYFWLVKARVCQSYYLFKGSALRFVDSLFLLHVLISALIFRLVLDLVCSCFSTSVTCIIKSFICVFSDFFHSEE